MLPRSIPKCFKQKECFLCNNKLIQKPLIASNHLHCPKCLDVHLYINKYGDDYFRIFVSYFEITYFSSKKTYIGREQYGYREIKIINMCPSTLKNLLFDLTLTKLNTLFE